MELAESYRDTSTHTKQEEVCEFTHFPPEAFLMRLKRLLLAHEWPIVRGKSKKPFVRPSVNTEQIHRPPCKQGWMGTLARRWKLPTDSDVILVVCLVIHAAGIHRVAGKLLSGLVPTAFLSFHIVFTQLFIDLVCQTSIWHIVDINIVKIGSFSAAGQQKNPKHLWFIYFCLKLRPLFFYPNF